MMKKGIDPEKEGVYKEEDLNEFREKNGRGLLKGLVFLFLRA